MGWFRKQAKGSLRYVDGTHIKLHQHGLQGATLTREKEAVGLSREGMTTKCLAWADKLGLLCDFTLHAGNIMTSPLLVRVWKPSGAHAGARALPCDGGLHARRNEPCPGQRLKRPGL